MKILKLIGIFVIVPCILLGRDFPALTGPVVDEIHLLTDTQKESLERDLKAFYEKTGHQIQLVIIHSLEGDNLEEFSIRLAEKLKMGKAKKDTGIIFLIVFKDRKMRIEVGSGIEGDLTDAESKRIIDSVVPFFKKGEYPAGVFMGIKSLIENLGGELEIPEFKTQESSENPPLAAIIVLLFFLVFFSMISMAIKGIRGAARKKGWKGFLISSGRSSSFGGGGWSSGGGWSGGGGSFSGGGASGSW